MAGIASATQPANGASTASFVPISSPPRSTTNKATASTAEIQIARRSVYFTTDRIKDFSPVPR